MENGRANTSRSLRTRRNVHHELRDMCMIGHLDDIMDAGIDIKIEGRAKSALYRHRHGGLPPCARRGRGGETPDPVWLDEGRARQSLPLFDRHVRSAGAVLRQFPLHPRLAGRGGGRSCGRERHGDAQPAQQVSRGRHGGGRRPDCKPFSMVVPEMRDAEGFPAAARAEKSHGIHHACYWRSVPAITLCHAVDLSARD